MWSSPQAGARRPSAGRRRRGILAGEAGALDNRDEPDGSSTQRDRAHAEALATGILAWCSRDKSSNLLCYNILQLSQRFTDGRTCRETVDAVEKHDPTARAIPVLLPWLPH
jgi:hypothetical protein